MCRYRYILIPLLMLQTLDRAEGQLEPHALHIPGAGAFESATAFLNGDTTPPQLQSEPLSLPIIPARIHVPAQCRIERQALMLWNMEVKYGSPTSSWTRFNHELEVSCHYEIQSGGCSTLYVLEEVSCPPGYSVLGVEVNNGTTLELVDKKEYCKDPQTGSTEILTKYDPPLSLGFGTFTLDTLVAFDPRYDRLSPITRTIETFDENGLWKSSRSADCNHIDSSAQHTGALREAHEDCFGGNQVLLDDAYSTVEHLPASTTDQIVCISDEERKLMVPEERR